MNILSRLSCILLSLCLLSSAAFAADLSGTLSGTYTYDDIVTMTGPITVSGDVELTSTKQYGTAAFTLDGNLTVGSGDSLKLSGATSTLLETHGSSIAINGDFTIGNRDDSVDFIDSTRTSQITIGSNGKLTYSPDDVYHGIHLFGINVAIEDGGTLTADTIIGFHHNTVNTNGNLIVREIQIDDSTLTEQATVTIDGVGGTGTTRQTIMVDQDRGEGPGVYVGNIIVNHDGPFDEQGYAMGGLFIGGVVRGNVEFRKGLLDFYLGGYIDGNLTIYNDIDGLFPEDDATPDLSEYVKGNVFFAGGTVTFSPHEWVEIPDELLITGSTIDASATELRTPEIKITKGTLDARQVTVTNGITVSGTDSSLNLVGDAAAISTAKNLSIDKGASAVIGNLALADDTGSITVGDANDTVGSTLSADFINLKGGSLLVDPAWGATSSNVAIAKIADVPDAANIIVNGKVGLGRNSYLTIGTRDTNWLPGEVGPLEETGVQSALGLFQPLQVGSGQAIMVDGAMSNADLQTELATAADTVTFAANSLLVINGNTINGENNPAISFENDGKVKVDKGARLLIANAQDGRKYLVAEVAKVEHDTTYTATTAWKGANLATSSPLLSVTSDDGALFRVSRNTSTAAQTYPGLSGDAAQMVEVLYGAAGTAYYNTDSPQAGIRFLSRATDTFYAGGDPQTTAETIESAARLSLAGAVPHMTSLAASAGHQAVLGRFTGAAGILEGARADGTALWITPLWRQASAWGLDAGDLGYGYHGNIGGLALGVDHTFGIAPGNFLRVGLSAHMGGGHAWSDGDFNDTSNSMTFWGLEAWLGWHYGAWGLLADVGYTGAWHQLEQEMPASMQMADLESDVASGAWQAGLRLQHTITTPALDITPHVGARYTHVQVFGHDVQSSGTLLHGEGYSQDIWTFPMGVTLDKTFHTASGWQIRPSLDVSAIPATGDLKARQSVSFSGLPGSYELESRVQEEMTWQASLGLDVGKGDFSLGVHYTAQTGSKSSGHGLFARFCWEF